ncbi:MAG TPA: TIGR02647 family protein [Methylococcaceae bacterium]|nr:TIGR02647 family protein [Methylococcaceae bacterium]
MLFKQDVVDELNILARYNLTSLQEGIKVHHDASPQVIAATARLFHKGLVTQEDGGYLTHLGIEVAQKVQSVLTTLSAE